MSTAQELLERSFLRFPSHVAVIDADRQLTYADLGERSTRLAAAFRRLGADLQHPVALLLPNCAEYIECDVATARGAILRVGIGERLTAEEVRFILEDSAAAVLVTMRTLLETLQAAQVPVPTTLCVGAEYERLIADSVADGAEPVAAPHDPAYLMYTSGTTGRPKGALHTQGSRLASTVNMLSCEQQLTADSVMVHAGPLTHGSGSKVLGILGMGGANLTLSRFRPESFAEAVRSHGGTHTFLVPTMLQRLVMAAPDVHDAVRGMRQITVGGAPISPDSFRRAIEAFGPILTQIYGASEAPHPLTLLRPDDYSADLSDELLRSAGYPAPSVSLKILAADGTPVPTGAVGELVVRAPSVMVGYWGRPDATADVLDADGWYHTGDLLSRSPSGAITFQDRKRDLVITGGMNVYPAEVERVLDEHPEIAQSAVLGYPDEEWVESLAAFVVRVPGSNLGVAEVQEWVKSRLAGYKKPRRVEFLDVLPMGSTNKVVKGPLRDMLWAGHDRRV